MPARRAPASPSSICGITGRRSKPRERLRLPRRMQWRGLGEAEATGPSRPSQTPASRRKGRRQGDQGQLLVIAGSRDVPGAALLTAAAAMRAGAGKLQIATVQSVASQLGIAMPEAMVVGLPQAADGGFAAAAVKRVGELAAEADAIVA